MFKAFKSKTCKLACGAILLATTAVSAHAATWTGNVGRVTYDFYTQEGTIEDLVGTSDAPGVLHDEAWWGNPDLASQFASVVGDHLGGLTYDFTADFGDYTGPIFAAFRDSGGALYGAFAYGGPGNSVSFGQQLGSGTYTFVRANQVAIAAPEIDSRVLPAAVFLIAVLFFGYYRSRDRRALSGSL